jgi:hypothetical protein
MNVSGELQSQVGKMSQIPATVLRNWPAVFAFSVVNYITGMIVGALPQADGTSGAVERALINSTASVIRFVTWDVSKSP